MTTLGVFFTRGVSLKQWEDSGLFDREVLIYREHLSNGLFDTVYWFTYGATDSGVAERLVSQGRLPEKIHVIPSPRWLVPFGRGASLLYSVLMPAIAMHALRKCDVFKTNQMDGSIAAVLAAIWLRRPLFVRTGYSLSMFVDRIHPRNPFRRGFAWLTEAIAFRNCDASSVSSRFDREYVVSRYSVAAQPPDIIGNYVDTVAFAPRADGSRRERLVFVGRISPQKNLAEAIAACASARIGLDIVGDGPNRDALEKLAVALHADVAWLGIVPNEKLPALLGAYRYFLLVSLWEGMPKALLEAMSAGLVCIGNDTTGINELITDGVTGYLSAGPAARQIETAIRRAREGEREGVSMAARAHICQHFSLEAVAAREREVFVRLIGAREAAAGAPT